MIHTFSMFISHKIFLTTISQKISFKLIFSVNVFNICSKEIAIFMCNTYLISPKSFRDPYWMKTLWKSFKARLRKEPNRLWMGILFQNRIRTKFNQAHKNAKRMLACNLHENTNFQSVKWNFLVVEYFKKMLLTFYQLYISNSFVLAELCNIISCRRNNTVTD